MVPQVYIKKLYQQNVPTGALCWYICIVITTCVSTGKLVLDGGDGEGECVGAEGEAVLREGECAPAVDTSESHLSIIHKHIGHVIAVNLAPMAVWLDRATVESLHEIVQGRGRERAVRCKFKSCPRGVEHSPAAQVSAGAGLLRAYVGVSLRLDAL